MTSFTNQMFNLRDHSWHILINVHYTYFSDAKNYGYGYAKNFQIWASNLPIRAIKLPFLENIRAIKIIK